MLERRAHSNTVHQPPNRRERSRERRNPLSQPNAIVQRVLAFVEANYAATITLRDVARVFSYSPAHLTHVFSRHTGKPITAWIIERRIHAAASLLIETSWPVAVICEAVGFNDVCYFTRQFVRHFGVTPGRFRRRTIERRESFEIA